MNDVTAILCLGMTATIFFCFGKIWKNDSIDRTWKLRFNLLFSDICGQCLKDRKKEIDDCKMCTFCKCKPLMDTYKKLEDIN